MKKITLFGLSAVVLTISCTKKKDTTDADLIAVEKPTLISASAIDIATSKPAKFATYDYITGHAVNETAQTDGEACPNCSFTDFETGAKFLFTVDPSKKTYTFFQTQADYLKIYSIEESLDTYAKGDVIEQTVPANIRSTPKGFLNPRYAQTYINDGFEFGILTLLSIMSEIDVVSLKDKRYKYNTDQGIVAKIDGGGVLLKNYNATGFAVVNGQLTNGMVRAWHTKGNKGGFVSAKDNNIDKKLLDLGFANTDNFSSRPDNVQIEFAYAPAGGDKASFDFLFFDATSVRRLPAQTPEYKGGKSDAKEYVVVDEREFGYVRVMVQAAGDVAAHTFVKIKAPVYYKNQTGKPQGLLMNISAGDGYNAKANSELLVKSIQFCYGSVCK